MLKTSALFALVVASGANAGTLDFETTPGGGSPFDDLSLDRTAMYGSDGVGVFFGLDTTDDGYADTDAVFEHHDSGGGGYEGFYSTLATSRRDVEAPGFEGRLGSYFLRTPERIYDNNDPSTLVITFGSAVGSTSGEIWDIDARRSGAFERWIVRGFDSSGNEVASQLSPVGINDRSAGSLDSKPWTYSLSSGAGIDRVTIDYIGTAGTVGLAFDNFNAIAVPTPGAVVLGIAGLLCAGRRRR